MPHPIARTTAILALAACNASSDPPASESNLRYLHRRLRHCPCHHPRRDSGPLQLRQSRLPLELVVQDPLEVSQPPTLASLTAEAEAAFISKVADIRWEPDPLDGAMTVVTYQQPSVVVFGDIPPGREVVSRFTGPTSDDPPKYAILEFGVRQKAGETYLVFSRYGPKFDLHYAPSHAPLIRIDGDRIADTEPARALGIEGKTVSDVIAEIRRLKGN